MAINQIGLLSSQIIELLNLRDNYFRFITIKDSSIYLYLLKMCFGEGVGDETFPFF